MTKLQKLKREQDLVIDLLNVLEKGYGKDKCRGYYPSCPNCMGQLLIGSLESHLDLLVWELDETEKEKKT